MTYRFTDDTRVTLDVWANTDDGKLSVATEDLDGERTIVWLSLEDLNDLRIALDQIEDKLVEHNAASNV